jgi:hypothetical protein
MLRVKNPLPTLLALCAFVVSPNVAMAAYENCVPSQVLAPEATIQTAPPNSLGCVKGGVIKLSDGSSVWRCTTGTDATLTSAKMMMLVSQDGSAKSLPDSTSPDGLMRFSVWIIDLDNDGTGERILSYWNGRGEDGVANSWTSVVFRADWANLTPAGQNNDRNMAGASDIHDWGLKNLFKDPNSAGKCLLGISEFKMHNSVNGLKVDFYALGTDSLVVSRSLPPVFRVLNTRFTSQRRRAYRTSPYSGNVTSWISARDTKSLPMP